MRAAIILETHAWIGGDIEPEIGSLFAYLGFGDTGETPNHAFDLADQNRLLQLIAMHLTGVTPHHCMAEAWRATLTPHTVNTDHGRAVIRLLSPEHGSPESLTVYHVCATHSGAYLMHIATARGDYPVTFFRVELEG